MVSDNKIDEIYQRAISAIYHSGNRCDPFDPNIGINPSTRIAGQLGVMGRLLHFLEISGIPHEDQLRVVAQVGSNHKMDNIFTTMSKTNLEWYEILRQRPAREAIRMTGGDIEFYQRESERWSKWEEEAEKLNLLK